MKTSDKGVYMRAAMWLICGCLLSAGAAMGSEQYTSTVSIVQSPNYNEDCCFFQLAGVGQADPVNPNNPWFGVPSNQIGYIEIVSMIISAHLSGSTVQVFTTGAAAGGACGPYAQVAWINLE